MPYFMYADNVGVIQLGDDPGLAQELPDLRVIQLEPTADFHGDDAVKLAIASLPNRAKRPGTQLLQ